MKELIEERDRLEAELFNNRFDLSSYQNKPNVVGTKQRPKVHRVFASMLWQGGKKVWLTACHLWLQRERGYAITSEPVSCADCRRRLEMVQ